MPDELIQAVRAYAGPRRFSQYVAEAVAERIRLDLLDEVSAQLQAEFGPFDEELVRQAMRLWPDYEDE
jgi:hypothetical protein